MNTFKKLERLQAANIKLTYENERLVEINKALAEEVERMKATADAAVKKAEEQMRECEKLKVTYDEVIATARLSQEKYTNLYRECLKLTKEIRKLKYKGD